MFPVYKRWSSFSYGLRLLSTAAKPKSPTAVVFMNLGGPATLPEVEPFLRNLFSDPEIIKIPFQKKAAQWIAKRRSPKVAAMYQQIGGGSPIKAWTQKQLDALVKVLDIQCPETAPHKGYIAFRYSSPSTESMIQELKQDGVTRAIAFTQYPQYSCTTTGSSINELFRQLQRYDSERNIKWSIIDRWGSHPGLIEAFAQRIEDKIKEYPIEQQKEVVVLFTAHSLPMASVNRGDSYPSEVSATVDRVMDRLGKKYPYRLVWQSQVGPQPWLGPQTNDAIKGFGKMKKNNILLVPIAFTSDHIETLFELDVEYAKVAEEAGITGLKRAESLNDFPVFVQGLASVFKEHIIQKVPTSPQMTLRCPHCTNITCEEAKTYFAAEKRL